MTKRNTPLYVGASLLACAFLSSTAMAQIVGRQTGGDHVVHKGPYTAPRTAYGHPDLQGTWTNASLTKLERADQYGEKLVISEAEVKAWEGGNKEVVDLGNAKTSTTATVKDLPADCSGGRVTNCNYNAGWTDPGEAVMRILGVPRSSLITTTKNGKVPPLTEDGKRRLAARTRTLTNDHPETRSLGERCLAVGNTPGPVMVSGLYNNNYVLIQNKDTVAIVIEMAHDVRTVRIGGKHLPSNVRPWFGDSIGHYEGDTLVVETTNFSPQQHVRGSSENLKVIEKFKRIAPNELLYQFTVEDPTTFTESWGGEYTFKPSPGPQYEYACHEGNYGLENMLAGSRAEEREKAEADAKLKVSAAQ